MAAALAVARRGLGRVWPNPAVGCVLVDDAGHVVARGWTQPGGRPHAETVALARAGNRAGGATAYVTLEPCSHQGVTPPCTDALINAGVRRVVASTVDPDPRVNGRGFRRLRDAGLAVTTGVAEAEARALNAGFFQRVEHGRPHLTLKLATTLDGRIATSAGASRWITGPHARAFVHRLRLIHDAVLVGSMTAFRDDPDLTCRLPGLPARSPVRVVMDSRLRLALTSRLVATAQENPTWLVTLAGGDARRLDAFRSAGVELIEVPAAPVGIVDAAAALRELARRGITRLLVEGGARLAASLLHEDLVDEIVWFRAPSILGGDAVAAVDALGVDDLDHLRRYDRTDVRRLGEDVVETLVRQA